MKIDLHKWPPLIVCVILGFLLSRAIPPRQPKSYLPELLAEKDRQIEDLKVREKAAEHRADSARREAQKKIDRDTIYLTKLINNDKKIQAVISGVDNATKAELRRIVSEY